MARRSVAVLGFGCLIAAGLASLGGCSGLTAQPTAMLAGPAMVPPHVAAAPVQQLPAYPVRADGELSNGLGLASYYY